MKKSIFILFFAAFLGVINCQSFELIPNADTTGFVILEKGETEIFSDTATIVNEILSEIQISYSAIARSKKHIYENEKKAKTLNAALKQIHTDSSYLKYTDTQAESFINGKWRLKINGTVYNVTSNNANTRLKNDNDGSQFWTVNYYSNLYIELKRVDIDGELNNYYLFRNERGLYRTIDNDPNIVLWKKIKTKKAKSTRYISTTKL